MFKACRVTFNGTRYQIDRHGNVDTVDPNGNTVAYVADEALRKAVRAEAARQRRNRGARERHQARVDLGLHRNRYGGYE